MNHDDEVVETERYNISQEIEHVTLESMQPAEQEVAKRLTTSIVNTYLDTKDIDFERQESYLSISPAKKILQSDICLINVGASWNFLTSYHS